MPPTKLLPPGFGKPMSVASKQRSHTTLDMLFVGGRVYVCDQPQICGEVVRVMPMMGRVIVRLDPPHANWRGRLRSFRPERLVIFPDWLPRTTSRRPRFRVTSPRVLGVRDAPHPAGNTSPTDGPPAASFDPIAPLHSRKGGSLARARSRMRLTMIWV